MNKVGGEDGGRGDVGETVTSIYVSSGGKASIPPCGGNAGGDAVDIEGNRRDGGEAYGGVGNGAAERGGGGGFGSCGGIGEAAAPPYDGSGYEAQLLPLSVTTTVAVAAVAVSAIMSSRPVPILVLGAVKPSTLSVMVVVVAVVATLLPSPVIAKVLPDGRTKMVAY